MPKAIKVDQVERQKALLTIVGARLTSVQFVLNYLILGFDEKGAYTTLVWPELIFNGNTTVFGMKEYRDMLCGLIEKVVVGAEIDVEEVIRITFDTGMEMRIALRSYAGKGERGIMTAPKRFLYVF